MVQGVRGLGAVRARQAAHALQGVPLFLLLQQQQHHQCLQRHRECQHDARQLERVRRRREDAAARARPHALLHRREGQRAHAARRHARELSGESLHAARGESAHAVPRGESQQHAAVLLAHAGARRGRGSCSCCSAGGSGAAGCDG
eukprot:2066261-Rhodomonas_salina.1